MDNCCEWHGGLVGANIVEERSQQLVNINVYFCPECNSAWKTVSVQESNKELLTERLWGDEKEKYLSLYQNEVAALYNK